MMLKKLQLYVDRRQFRRRLKLFDEAKLDFVENLKGICEANPDLEKLCSQIERDTNPRTVEDYFFMYTKMYESHTPIGISKSIHDFSYRSLKEAYEYFKELQSFH